MIRVISLEEQKKRMKKWKRKSLGLLMFLACQRQAYRAKGFEHIGHHTKAGAYRLAEMLDRHGRDALLIDTGLVTLTAKIPMFDVYRSFKTRKGMKR